MYDVNLFSQFTDLCLQIFFFSLCCLLLEFDVFLHRQKLDELWVCGTASDVESDRKDFERVTAQSLVVLAHVVKEGVLVAQMVIVFEFRINLY